MLDDIFARLQISLAVQLPQGNDIGTWVVKFALVSPTGSCLAGVDIRCWYLGAIHSYINRRLSAGEQQPRARAWLGTIRYCTRCSMRRVRPAARAGPPAGAAVCWGRVNRNY